ncbi:class I SAM-dependent methyltransferase [Amycolatopsis sp. Hca4]|uniref:class I SAM-dependent DNA methyltransferase n=1 Tax=unclassified Amycolatopsis TaxID=2618356 RepID=UPI00159082E1|nr:class I SAM-dependent methyltransferase [Amycolatopsis sp. Hca4]QKV72795.1 methyltransferase domain-containing protein [Amycolatopsis sp. Hca4]
MTSYDAIADWYETTLVPGWRDDPLEFGPVVRDLLGPGTGPCLELGCGTGAHAERIRQLGRTPLGVDVSAGMLRHAAGRLPVVRGDATALPIATGALPAVVAIMVHTDMPEYPAVLREAARVLAPGGVFVHVGVHPCFCGGFADRTDGRAVVIRPGYREPGWTMESWSDQGLRDKVGATHRPLPALLGAVLEAGLVFERFAEGGEPTPTVFAWRARKPWPASGSLFSRDDWGSPNR